MKNLLVLLALLGLNTVSVNTFANEDGAYLDAPYKDLVHPVVDDFGLKKSGFVKSDTLAIVDYMSPVRSQGSRGTCSIFSAIAMLEGMLSLKGYFHKDNIDLSEEYLEYLAVRGRTGDGSNSYSNFSAIARYGVPYESTLPYIGDNWENNSFSTLAQSRCGHLTGNQKTSCLIIHRDPNQINRTDADLLNTNNPYYDPDFVAARTEARQFRSDFINLGSSYYSVYSVAQAKNLLQQGIPLTMGISFYYGAWNHRKAVEMGINRDMNSWDQGIVFYPVRGSMDRKMSPTKSAGHSILIVGYDDNKEVTQMVKMEDGSLKQFTFKGVYYFKNSWGTESFGANAQIEGQHLPGYGMIVQDYVHEYGSFYQLPIL